MANLQFVGNTPLANRSYRTYAVIIDGKRIGTAFKDRGLYEFGDFIGSKARLIAQVSA